MLSKSRSKRVTSNIKVNFTNDNNKNNTKNVKDITTVKVKGGLNVTHETIIDKTNNDNHHSSIKKGKLYKSSRSSVQKKDIEDLCSSSSVDIEKKTANDVLTASLSSSSSLVVGNNTNNTNMILEQVKLRLMQEPIAQECGLVRIRFNHYNKSFPIHNSVLQWADVDNEYCISFVYRGNFQRNLLFISGNDTNKIIIDQSKYAVADGLFSNYYIHLCNNDEYRLEVIEDPIAGIGIEGGIVSTNTGGLRADDLKSISSQNSRQISKLKSGNHAMDQLTMELKSISVQELDGEHAKDLIERRDLEDILYSSSIV